MNAKLINLSALFLVATVARYADAQGVNLAPATATDPLRAPPPGAAGADAPPPPQAADDAASESADSQTASPTSPTSPATPASPTAVTPAATTAATPAGTASSTAGGTVTVTLTPPTSATAKKLVDDGPLAMGLEPGAPAVAKLPTGATPSFSQSKRLDDWRFDFHGYLNLPLAIGFGDRPNAFEGQRKLTMHTPPRIPGSYETFDYTGIMPTPYAQLNFGYGNSFVTATVIIAARSVTDATSYFNPPEQMGINNAFLTFRVLNKPKDKVSLDVGALTNRYGMMGEYDLGRYGTPLIARLGGMGATATARFERGALRYMAEGGIMGQLNKAPVGEEPGSWNGYSDPNAGTSFALHAHAGIEYRRKATLGLHGIHTFVRDDRVAPYQVDGSINIVAADGRLSIGRFGHFYAGWSMTRANDARGVSSVLRVLNARGGYGLMNEYFGLTRDKNGAENTSGTLNTLGFEYDLSLGNLLRAPGTFNGRAPDISLGAFGIFSFVSDAAAGYSGTKKFKYGLEGAYSIFSWFALGGRYDRVMPDFGNAPRTHAILTGRLIFRSDWQAQDQLMLQYSRFLSGSQVWVQEGNPPTYDPKIVPDDDVLQLVATMWW